MTIDEIAELRDEGNALVKVRDLLSVLQNFRATHESQVQMILLDHIGPAAWTSLPDINLVTNWRGDGNRLIPMSWFSDQD